MKKILLSLGALGVTMALVPLFAAFEAHVVNVTAKIENALTVPVKVIDYGTVFPQEYLVRDLGVSLSQSFIDEERVDDVQYFIRQKPKCAITSNNGTSYDDTIGNDGTHSYTTTGHIKFDAAGLSYVDCGPAPRQLTDGEVWGVLPNLCPYLSKHKETDEAQILQEVQIDAFHQPWTIDGSTIDWNDAVGYLTKLGQDISDNWLIDLAVPCFGGYCAQDWATYVESHHAGEGVNAASWTQPIANEHKVFGCDLWVEVSGVSQTRN